MEDPPPSQRDPPPTLVASGKKRLEPLYLVVSVPDRRRYPALLFASTCYGGGSIVPCLFHPFDHRDRKTPGFEWGLTSD
jgi:hypothetical protein